MEKEVKGELVVLDSDQSTVKKLNAEKAQCYVRQIRGLFKRIDKRDKLTFINMTEIGISCLALKEINAEEDFTKQLRREIPGRVRAAQECMAVARWLQNEDYAKLNIQKSAAICLSGLNVPDEVRHEALKSAKAGEKITNKVARKMKAVALEKAEKEAKPDPKPLAVRLKDFMKQFQKRWNPPCRRSCYGASGIG